MRSSDVSVDLDDNEGSKPRGRWQAKQSGQESSGRLGVVRVDDGVVQRDGHDPL
jgi:hypothetical protein